MSEIAAAYLRFFQSQWASDGIHWLAARMAEPACIDDLVEAAVAHTVRRRFTRYGDLFIAASPDQPPTVTHWPDPTPEMLADDPLFDAIWRVIKSWDVNVPTIYSGYMGATGNHARAIYDEIMGHAPDLRSAIFPVNGYLCRHEKLSGAGGQCQDCGWSIQVYGRPNPYTSIQPNVTSEAGRAVHRAIMVDRGAGD